MYATAQDMTDRYGSHRMVQLTDVNVPMTGAVVSTVLDARLTDASGEIDGYLAGRMAVPVASPPAMLKLLCCRICYALLMRDNLSEADAADLKDARAYLRDVASGKISLTQPSAAEPLPGVGPVLFSTGDKVMSREAVGTSWSDTAR